MQTGYLSENEGSVKDLFRFYESMLPYISSLPSTFANTPENRLWTEKFLARYCLLSHRHVMTHPIRCRSLLSPAATIPPASVLAPFRAYAKGWDAGNSARSSGFASSSQVWRAYYDMLSDFLQNNIVQPVFRSKAQQYTELKNVEKTLEAIQLKETSFPRADQVNTQIEHWADQVMANWRVLCGLSWREEDLAGADKAALGRGVLDVGYCTLLDTHSSPSTSTVVADDMFNRYSIGSQLERFTQLEYCGTFSPFMHHWRSFILPAKRLTPISKFCLRAKPELRNLVRTRLASMTTLLHYPPPPQLSRCCANMVFERTLKNLSV